MMIVAVVSALPALATFEEDLGCYRRIWAQEAPRIQADIVAEEGQPRTEWGQTTFAGGIS